MENRQSYGMLLIGGVIALGSIGIAFLTANFEQKTNETAKIAVENNYKPGLSNYQEDTDQDGLANWKEELLGTDPNNPDSDNDGVSDGDEIALGADPLKEGSTPRPRSGEYSAPKSLPSTEALARELFVGYADGKKDGNLTTEETNKAISEAIQNRLKEDTSKKYSLSEIKTSVSANPSSYEDKLVSTLAESASVREYELTIFTRALNSSDNSELAKLEAAALVYKAINNKLLSMEVPTKAAEEHLALVNAVSKLSNSVNGLSLWNGDPLDALVLVNGFIAAETETTNAVENLFAFTSVLKKQS